MSARKLWLLFFVAFVICLVTLVPVSMITKVVTPPPGIAYKNLTGTLWNGKASQVQVDDVVLSKVQWSLKFWPLIIGKANVDVKFGNARDTNEVSGKGRVSLGLSSISAQDLVVRLPAEYVKPLLPIPLGKVGGRVILEIDEYSNSTEFVQNPSAPLCQLLQGDLMWTKSEVVFNNPIRMGTIQSQLSCEEEVLLANFDGSNELGLEGTAKIQSAQAFNFDGFVKPQPQLPTEVHQGIAMFSKLDSQGRYPIKL